MTQNWFILIVWLFFAAITFIEFTLRLSQKGWNDVFTYVLLVLFLISVFFVFKSRKRRNKEKWESYNRKKPSK
jgi:amino acid permease